MRVSSFVIREKYYHTYHLLCVFVNLALKLQCHVVKDTLLQTVFFGDMSFRNLLSVLKSYNGTSRVGSIGMANTCVRVQKINHY